MRILSTIHLTQHQQLVLALISASKDKPTAAAISISTGQNLVAARNMLMKFGVISYTPSHAILTTSGEQLAKDNDIIDDSGTLTEKGNSLLALVPGQKPVQNTQQVPQPAPDQVGAASDFDIGAEPGMESFSKMFKNMLLG